MESMLEIPPEQLEVHRLQAGMPAIEETAQLLIGPLFAMFKEKRLYSKRDTLATRAWREDLYTTLLQNWLTSSLQTSSRSRRVWWRGCWMAKQAR